ncbi:uncharacterized protein Fot_49188 [Forsythia ovata]|uniref:Uncharacterized protein n=1 Tax=Forsythia ovata TaxID=205694 RepID=A0ABD1QCE1_9LAMI
MVSENLMGNCGGGGFEEKGSEEISVSNHVNGFQYTAIKSDSLVLDMERLEKDINANSRIKLQRSLSRKGTFRGAEKKTISNTGNISPRAALHGGGTPEKPLYVAVGGGDNSINPPVHNQITIMNGSMGNTDVESKFVGKRLSFRRSSPSRTIDPRRILLFFATL